MYISHSFYFSGITLSNRNSRVDMQCQAYHQTQNYYTIILGKMLCRGIITLKTQEHIASASEKCIEKIFWSCITQSNINYKSNHLLHIYLYKLALKLRALHLFIIFKML